MPSPRPKPKPKPKPKPNPKPKPKHNHNPSPKTKPKLKPKPKPKYARGGLSPPLAYCSAPFRQLEVTGDVLSLVCRFGYVCSLLTSLHAWHSRFLSLRKYMHSFDHVGNCQANNNTPSSLFCYACE